MIKPTHVPHRLIALFLLQWGQIMEKYPCLEDLACLFFKITFIMGKRDLQYWQCIELSVLLKSFGISIKFSIPIFSHL